MVSSPERSTFNTVHHRQLDPATQPRTQASLGDHTSPWNNRHTHVGLKRRESANVPRTQWGGELQQCCTLHNNIGKGHPRGKSHVRGAADK